MKRQRNPGTIAKRVCRPRVSLRLNPGYARYKTEENRDKRKAIQDRRDAIAKTLPALRENAQQGQTALTRLYQSIETNLALAQHAEMWSWKQVNVDNAR